MTALLLAIVLLLASASAAHAFPLVAMAVAAIAGTTVAAMGTGLIIVTAVATVAIAAGASYAANKLLAPKPGSPQAAAAAAVVGGVELLPRIDHDVPMSLVLGRATTAGSLVYAETYGKRGEIDNSDLIEIMALADHPCHALVKVIAEGRERDLEDPDMGRGFRVHGYANKLALKFFDGTQTTADSFTVSKLGSHSRRPWTSNHALGGRSYMRLHTIYDPDKTPGPVTVRPVLDGALLYDPRLDDSVGGEGDHRLDDLDTHEWSANLALFVYNILRGIRVKDDDGDLHYFYGLEGTTAAQLPLDVWFAAMNACDEIIDGEPAFHGGAEITVDTHPFDAIAEIVKSCGGRFSEAGGIYKLYVGPPPLPIMHITDAMLRVNDACMLRPILPLEQRINCVTGSYTSPAEGWVPKVAPPRINAAAEAADGRRVQADLNLPWVQSGKHMQRLQKQMLAEARKERRHDIPLPPECWGLEPGDAFTWDSAENGYEEKGFLITQVESFADWSSRVSCIEIDETDYDWVAETDLIPQADADLAQDPPEPKAIDGFDAEPYLHEGDDGQLRPGIKLLWTPPEADDGEPDTPDADVTGIAIELRLKSAPADVTGLSVEGQEKVQEGETIILAGLAAVTLYEIRARFVTFTGLPAEWSEWIEVTTPDSRVSADRGAATTIVDYDFNLSGGGTHTSAWLEVTSREVVVDAITEFVDLAAIFGVIAITFGGGATNGRLEWRIMRDDDLVMPSPAFGDPQLTMISWTAFSGTLNAFVYDTRHYLDFPSSEGTYVYKWQVRIVITSGSGGASCNLSVGPARNRVLLPKNVI